MEKEPHELINIVRDYVHLTPEEVEGFVEESLDPYVWQEVAEHVASCPYCASDLDLLANMAEELPFDESVELEDTEVSDCLVERLPLMTVPQEVHSSFLPCYGQELRTSEPAVSEVVPDVLIRERRQVWKFWIGERCYPLQRISVCADPLEVVGLSVNELLRAILDDVRDAGKVPGAVEIPGRKPVVVSLADLVPASGPMESPEKSGLEAESDLRPDRECYFWGQNLLFIPVLNAPRDKTPESRAASVKEPEIGSDPCRRPGLSQLLAGWAYPREEDVVGSGWRKDRVQGGEETKSKNMPALEFDYTAPGLLVEILADLQSKKVYLRMIESL